MASTLFPPIVESWMPAFVASEGVSIPYTVSSLSAGGSGKIDYSLRLANSNKGIEETIPAGSPFSITGNKFTAGCTYKLQVRFNNEGKKSEWSRVCLLKAIKRPVFDCNLAGRKTLSIDTPTIQATLDAGDENLRSYIIKLYDGNGDEVYNSRVQYTNEFSPNAIYHEIPMKLINGMSYKCIISYTTENGYEGISPEYDFVVRTGTSMEINCTWEATVDYDNGAVHLEAHSIKGDDIYFRRLIITRASSEDNFTKWEDIKVTKGSYDAEFDDFTVKSGVYYNYGIQLYAPSNQTRSNMITLKEPIRIDLEYAHLTDKNLQFNVKFDTDISSYKHTVLESKVDTIGSKYPYIRRNAAVNYKQFSLSGLISWETDIEGKFVTDEDIYANPNLYKDAQIDENGDKHYLENRMIYKGISDSIAKRGNTSPDLNWDLVGAEVINHYDYIYERGFRELILDFFYNGKAKLFRSTPEGNILVKLMDVSLTPKKELSRMIYSFTCTAVEVDEDSIDKYKEYEIIEWDNNLLTDLEAKYDILPIAQAVINPSEVGGLDILTTVLSSKHKSFYYGHTSSVIRRLRYLKLTFYCDQTYLNETDDMTDPIIQERKAQHPDSINLGNGQYAQGFRFYTDKGEVIVPARQGYLTYVDDDLKDANPAFPWNATFVPAPYTTGIYVFNGKDTNIQGLYFDSESNYEVCLEYSAEIASYESIDPTGGTAPDYIYENRTIEGQLRGDFAAGEEFYNILYNRFNYNFTDSISPSERCFSTFLSFNMIEIEAAPGTQIQYKLKNGTTQTATVDYTGVFWLNNPDDIIESFQFVNDTNAYVNFVVELFTGYYKET